MSRESHLCQSKKFSQYMYTEEYLFWIYKIIFNAPHAYLLLPYSPQILQGHCPLVLTPSPGLSLSYQYMKFPLPIGSLYVNAISGGSTLGRRGERRGAEWGPLLPQGRRHGRDLLAPRDQVSNRLNERFSLHYIILHIWSRAKMVQLQCDHDGCAS